MQSGRYEERMVGKKKHKLDGRQVKMKEREVNREKGKKKGK